MQLSTGILIPCCLFILLSSGCDVYGRRCIEIILPQGCCASEWIIEYPEKIEDGRLVFVSEVVAVDPFKTETTVRVRMARGVNLPVFAWPIWSGIAGGFPAGAVYPADASGGTITLNWENGFTCEILKACLLNSDAVTSLDTVRFRESLKERSSGFTDDDGRPLPGGFWLIDTVSLKSRLGYGLFRESAIKASRTESFIIPVSGECFFSDNPFYPLVESFCTEDESFIEVTVPENRRTLFCSPAFEEIIEVFFDDSRWCWINQAIGASGSGRM